MKLKPPPFEVWYFVIILALAVIFGGCATKTHNLNISYVKGVSSYAQVAYGE